MKIVFLLSFFLPCFAVSAQSWTKKHPTFQPYIIYIKETLPSNLKDELKNIHFLDARPDTSKLGFIPANASVYFKLTTDQPLQKIFAPDTASTLGINTSLSYLLVVRKLWISESIIAEEFKDNKPLHNYKINQPLSKCNAVIEVYGKRNDTYYPCFRMDTAFIIRKSLQLSVPNLIWLPFSHCLYKLKGQDWKAVQTRRKQMSYDEVVAFTNERKFDPIQKLANLRKGVFYTFADFLNNTPNSADFEIKNGSFTDEVTLNTDSKSILLDKFWGCFDGEQLFIKIGFNLFPVYPVQNTFELWGTTQLEQKYAQGASSFGTSHTESTVGSVMKTFNSRKISARVKPMKLSMETGEVY